MFEMLVEIFNFLNAGNKSKPQLLEDNF